MSWLVPAFEPWLGSFDVLAPPAEPPSNGSELNRPARPLVYLMSRSRLIYSIAS